MALAVDRETTAAAYRKVATENFPEFAPTEVNTFIQQFFAFDENGDGSKIF
jgi:hypothetical protein